MYGRTRVRRCGVTSVVVGLVATLLPVLFGSVSAGSTATVGEDGTARLASGRATEIFVSRDGRDWWSGTRSRPFATIARAQRAARVALPNASGDVVVNIAGGTYRLRQPLTLTNADSGRNGHRMVFQPLGYVGGPGTSERSTSYDHVVISGGRRVSNWRMFDHRLNIWKADVGSLESRQLYVDGKRAPRASIPNKLATIETAAGLTITDPSHAPAWSDPADIEAVWVRTAVWFSAPRCGVAAIVSVEIIFDQPCFSRLVGSADVGTNPTRKPTAWENSLSFLTVPGTHVLDTSRPGHHMLYYIPRRGEDMRQVNVMIPVLQTLVQAQGTQADPIRDVTFRGLTFSYATWNYPSSAAGFVHQLSEQYWSSDPTVYPEGETSQVPGTLRFLYVDRIRLEQNIFEHLGAEALEFAGTNNVINGNVITDTSSGGILLGNAQPSTRDSISNNNRITNNWIHDVGQEYYGGTGITAIQPNKIVIAHNQINGLPDRGIFVCGVTPTCPGPGTMGARVLNNRVFDVMRMMGDGGGIYMVADQGTSYRTGALVRGNVVYNTNRVKPKPGVTITINYGLYPDFGARWVTFKRNVVYNVMYSIGGLSAAGPLQAQDLRLIRNFWIHRDPEFGPAPAGNLVKRYNTVLPKRGSKAACLKIPVCARVYRRAGLSPQFRFLLHQA